MVADIRIEDNVVSVEDTDPEKSVTQLKVKAWDLVLDAPDRRTNQNGDRRALVHGPGDNLTINWENDYPGGVNIQGTVELGSIFARDDNLLIRAPGSGNRTIMTGDTIICSQFIGYESIGYGKNKPHFGRGTTKTPMYDDLDLVAEIKKLRTQVDELMKKVG